jgi:hypothetical protein
MPDERNYDLSEILRVITVKEAADWWGRASTTVLMKLMTAERKNNKIYLRKSGGTWLTTVAAMREVYGATENERPDYEKGN